MAEIPSMEDFPALAKSATKSTKKTNSTATAPEEHAGSAMKMAGGSGDEHQRGASVMSAHSVPAQAKPAGMLDQATTVAEVHRIFKEKLRTRPAVQELSEEETNHIWEKLKDLKVPLGKGNHKTTAAKKERLCKYLEEHLFRQLPASQDGKKKTGSSPASPAGKRSGDAPPQKGRGAGGGRGRGAKADATSSRGRGDGSASRPGGGARDHARAQSAPPPDTDHPDDRFAGPPRVRRALFRDGPHPSPTDVFEGDFGDEADDAADDAAYMAFQRTRGDPPGGQGRPAAQRSTRRDESGAGRGRPAPVQGPPTDGENRDILLQILEKVSSVEGRVSVLETGNGSRALGGDNSLGARLAADRMDSTPYVARPASATRRLPAVSYAEDETDYVPLSETRRRRDQEMIKEAEFRRAIDVLGRVSGYKTWRLPPDTDTTAALLVAESLEMYGSFAARTRAEPMTSSTRTRMEADRLARQMDSMIREFGEAGLRSDTMELMAGDFAALVEYERTRTWDFQRMLRAEQGDGSGIKASMQQRAHRFGVERQKLQSRPQEHPDGPQ